VREHIAIKAAVVARDEREGGLRKTLNFGHTIGHAVEALSGYTMLHGECVAVGMVAEARIAASLNVADRSLAATIARLLHAAGLPTSVPRSMSPSAVLEATRHDKKARAGVVEYALPRRLGEMAGGDRGYAIPVPDAAVLEALC
jgi:3-dehydroquinate synthase